MGEVKDPKGAKNVPIRMRVGGKNYIIGSVSAEDRTQVKFDLKDAIIYFMGYIDDDPVSDTEVCYDFDGVYKDEDLDIKAQENGTTKANAVDVKPAKKEKKVEKKEEKGSGDNGEEDSNFGVDYEASLDGAEHDLSKF